MKDMVKGILIVINFITALVLCFITMGYVLLISYLHTWTYLWYLVLALVLNLVILLGMLVLNEWIKEL